MKIENAKTTFFTDKEHYLAFRKAWSDAVNSPKAKSHLEPCDEMIKHGCRHQQVKGTGKHRVPGWIDASHVLLYNLLREKDLGYGFTPVTNNRKLNHGCRTYEGLFLAWEKLHNVTHNAKTYITAKQNNKVLDHYKWAKKFVDEFIEPFNTAVTYEMLVELDKHLPTRQVIVDMTRQYKEAA